MNVVFVLVILLVSLFVAAMVGYGFGLRDGLENGFKEGVEAEKLKHIDKVEPRWMVEAEKLEAIQEFAERLKATVYDSSLQNGDVHFVALYKAVEKLTKELTE
jgi:hypothetical protein